jgi:hypothetical protein
MARLQDVHQRQCDSRASLSSAVLQQLRDAYLRIREELSPGGWRLSDEVTAPARGQFIVRLSMFCDGIVVSECGFVIAAARSVEFARPGNRRITRALDAVSEAEFQRLIGLWVDEVRAGIAHCWRYEAKRLDGSPLQPRALISDLERSRRSWRTMTPDASVARPH